MKLLFKVFTLALFFVLLPVTVFSILSGLFKNEKASSPLSSEYNFVVNADTPAVINSGGEGGVGGCEGAAGVGGCEGGSGGGGK